MFPLSTRTAKWLGLHNPGKAFSLGAIGTLEALIVLWLATKYLPSPEHASQTFPDFVATVFTLSAAAVVSIVYFHKVREGWPAARLWATLSMLGSVSTHIAMGSMPEAIASVFIGTIVLMLAVCNDETEKAPAK